MQQVTTLIYCLKIGVHYNLGHAKNEAVTNPAGNTRNGKSRKTLKGEFGELPVEIPRDRHGSFEPHHPQTSDPLERLRREDTSLYARGMTVREIQGHLEESERVAV